MTKREAKKLIKNAISEGRNALLEPEAKELLSAWRVTVPKSIIIKGGKEVGSKLNTISPPYVLKVVSPDILHKSDIGGVVTGLKNENEIKQALKGIKKNVSKKVPKAHIEGFLFEEMAPKGNEIIIGGLRDEQFGPTVMFGIGGVAVELLKDVSYRLAPISEAEAIEMIKEVKSYPLLTGFRGSKRVDLNKLADAIIRVSEMIVEIEDIKEIEINPLIVSKNSLIAGDVRVLFDKV